jgi:DNA repair exonuclease SbcCD nuclease subunit
MIILTDLHLNNFKQWSTIENGMNSRLLDQVRVVNWVSDLINTEGHKTVVFLGDMIHSYADTLHKTVYNAMHYAVHSWSEEAMLYIIVGNHDIYHNLHIFDPYKDMPRVRVISEPLLNQHLEMWDVDMIPWGYDLPKKKSSVLMAHIPVYGAIMNAAGIPGLEGVPVTALEGYKYAFLGHYHEAQELKVPKAQWAGYIGAAMQIDVSTTPQNKGLTLFQGNKVEFVEIPSPRIYTETITSHDQLQELIPKIGGGTDYWRLTVTEPGIEIPTFDHRVQVEYDLKPQVESRLEERPGEDLKETVVRFIDMVDTKIDKKVAKKLADEVMQ